MLVVFATSSEEAFNEYRQKRSGQTQMVRNFAHCQMDAWKQGRFFLQLY